MRLNINALFTFSFYINALKGFSEWNFSHHKEVTSRLITHVLNNINSCLLYEQIYACETKLISKRLRDMLFKMISSIKFMICVYKLRSHLCHVKYSFHITKCKSHFQINRIWKRFVESWKQFLVSWSGLMTLLVTDCVAMCLSIAFDLGSKLIKWFFLSRLDNVSCCLGNKVWKINCFMLTLLIQ